MHRRPPRPLLTRVDSATPAQYAPPYLQPKAELEDDQIRRHELHGEHPVRELNGQDEIVQIADKTDDAVLPLQGRQDVSELPEPKDLSWEMPHHERIEVMGDEIAQELEGSIQGRENPIAGEIVQELESNPWY